MNSDLQTGSDIVQTLLDVTIASRHDLMLLAVGIICYLVLVSSRAQSKRAHHAAKLSSGADAPQQPLSRVECTSQRYETLLSLHVAKHEHAEVQHLIDSVLAEDVIIGEATMNSLLSICISSKDTR